MQKKSDGKKWPIHRCKFTEYQPAGITCMSVSRDKTILALGKTLHPDFKQAEKTTTLSCGALLRISDLLSH